MEIPQFEINSVDIIISLAIDVAYIVWVKNMAECFYLYTNYQHFKSFIKYYDLYLLRYDHPNGLNRIHICVFYQKNKQVFFIKMWYILCFYF